MNKSDLLERRTDLRQCQVRNTDGLFIENETRDFIEIERSSNLAIETLLVDSFRSRRQ